jgi:hypothetical protein
MLAPKGVGGVDGTAGRSALEYGSLCPQEGKPNKVVKEVVNPITGKVINMHRNSTGESRPEGIRKIEHVPTQNKGPVEGSKRSFPWVVSTQTGYNNPVQYEDPPEQGKRPSHPVFADGVIAIEHKKCFPEHANAKTAIVPPVLCKAPKDSWGGWSRGGCPGRRRQDGPWDSMQPKSGDDDAQLAEFRFSDARTKRFPEMKYAPTFHLTRWHLDPEAHVDLRKQTRVHLNDPVPTQAGAQLPECLYDAAAGKPSGLPAEGAGLSFYDRVRDADDEAGAKWAFRTAPFTAR